MQKLFISQPMRDKTNEEILSTRKQIKETVEDLLGEEVEVLDTFFKDVPHDKRPLWYLAKSLELLSMADIVYFADKWQDYRGCKIEHDCAVAYNLKILN